MKNITTAEIYELPIYAKNLANLADSRLGAFVISCSNEFFGKADRMLSHKTPIFIFDKFDEHGKWVDGWETARKRESGYDWCIVQLGCSGSVKLIEVDTSFFTGNYPASVSIDACFCEKQKDLTQANWINLVSNQELSGNQHHFFQVNSPDTYTHIRLNIFPDGGVARLKVFGKIHFNFKPYENQLINLCLAKYGARIVAYSDAHFGHPDNLLQEHDGINMGDGWETARRRAPGFDWCIIKLACPIKKIDKIDIDTAYFKGNYPAHASIQAIYCEETATRQQLITQSMFWPYLLPKVALKADQNHEFHDKIVNFDLINYIRLNMLPDGGISRLRLWAKMNNRM